MFKFNDAITKGNIVDTKKNKGYLSHDNPVKTDFMKQALILFNLKYS